MMQSFESSSFSLIPLLALSFGTCSYPSRKSFLYVARLSLLLLLLLLLNFPKTRTGRPTACSSTMRNFQLGRRKKGLAVRFGCFGAGGKSQSPSLFRGFTAPFRRQEPGVAFAGRISWWSCKSDQVRWLVYCSQGLVLSTWPIRTAQPPTGITGGKSGLSFFRCFPPLFFGLLVLLPE